MMKGSADRVRARVELLDDLLCKARMKFCYVHLAMNFIPLNFSQLQAQVIYFELFKFHTGVCDEFITPAHS